MRKRTGGAEDDSKEEDQKLEGARPTSYPPTVRSYAVDTAHSSRKVWLVKVPEVFAELVNRSSISRSNAPVATILPATGAGSKRSSRKLVVEVNKARVVGVLGDEGLKRTPLRYNLTVAEPVGARIFSQATAGGPFSLLGATGHNGIMTPDMTHPSYRGYAAYRREQLQKEDNSRSRSTLATTAEASFAAERLVRELRADYLTSIAPTKAASITQYGGEGMPRPRTVLEAFERNAYWTLKNLAEAIGTREADLRADVTQYCDYIRSGEYSRHYVLKPQYLTTGMPVPDSSIDAHKAGATSGPAD